MSADLFDLRAKVTPQALMVLRAVAGVRGIDISTLARDILHEWAAARLAEAAAINEVVAAPEVECEVSLRIHRVALSGAARKALYVRDEGICRECRMTLDREGPWHIDHIVPVVAGGTNDDANLRLTCAPCNLRKGAKTISEVKAA